MNDQETVYRIVHQDHQGLPTATAALYMDITQRRVQQLLKALEKKAPGLFPILTKLQARDYHLFTVEGWTMIEIAEDTDRCMSTVSESIKACVRKGMPVPAKKNRVLRYDPSMDGQIKERF